MAAIWSHTATESGPADGTAMAIGGAGSGDEVKGTHTTVRRNVLASVIEMTTQGRVFSISEPRGSRLGNSTQ